jgi:hypothetical protein
VIPEDLVGAADGLHAVAGDLEAAADRHQAVAAGSRSVVGALPSAWASPHSSQLQREATSILGAVSPVPGALRVSSSALRRLGATAVELAEDLRRQLAAASSASASLDAARRELGRLDDDPDRRRTLQQRVSEHAGAARAAEASIAAIEARWESACRSCSSTLDGSASALTAALLGPEGALSAEHAMVAAAAGGSWRDALASARAWGSGPLGRGDARATSLTDVVATLGPGPLTTAEYRTLADEHVRNLLPEGREDDKYARNAAVTRAYAELYFLDPGTYKWAGMAAFASDLVGDGIRQAEAGRTSGLPWIPGLSDFSFTDLSRSLQAGNALVFVDIYWQHLAYEHGGMAAIEAAWRDDELHQLTYDGWRTIDEGRRTGGTEAVWTGNAQLLRYEQEFTLQEGVYDHQRRTFKRLSSEVSGLVAPLTSPIPGDPVTFQDHHSWGDLGDFDDRWSWITESMLPAWREHEPALQEDLWQFTR